MSILENVEPLKKRPPFAPLFLATFVALLGLVIAASALHYQTVESFDLTGINYDGRAVKEPLFSVRRLLEYKSGNVKSIELSFDLKAFSLNSRDDNASYDLFQTAPLNEGLRLEFARPGTLALIAATDQPPGYKVYVISSALDLDKWHHFYLNVDPSDRIIIRFDGVRIVDAPDIELAYKVSDVAVGSGFSLRRPYNGEIHSASIKYRVYQPNPITTSPFVRIIEAALLLANLLFLFLLSGDTFSEGVNSPPPLGRRAL